MGAGQRMFDGIDGAAEGKPRKCSKCKGRELRWDGVLRVWVCAACGKYNKVKRVRQADKGS